jgi:hypothetical protein
VIQITATLLVQSLNRVVQEAGMNTEWSLASQRASQPMKWYDLVTLAILAASAIIAVFGWLIFDGSNAF